MTDRIVLKNGEGATTAVDGWTRFFLRSNPAPFLWLTVLLMLLCFWIFRNPSVSMTVHDYPFLFFLGLSPIVMVRAVQLIMKQSHEKRLRIQKDSYRRGPRFRIGFPLIVMICWPLLYYQWPMTMAFAYSRATLDRMADEALLDPQQMVSFRGRWAGLYQIAAAKVIGKTVVFYFGFHSRYWGFARVPGAQIDPIIHDREMEGRPERWETYFRDFPTGEDRWCNIEGKRFSGDWFVFYPSYWVILCSEG